MSKVWIGTSGWTYDGWRGPFYPTDLTKTKWLCWYASQFPTTEINGSFYRTLTEGSSGVARPNPKGFLFAWKALPVVPQDLDQSAAAAAEHEQMAAVRIAPEQLLHLQRQAVKALAHVGMTGRLGRRSSY